MCVCVWGGGPNGYVSFKTRERELSFFVLFLKEIMSSHMWPCTEHEHHGYQMDEMQMIECD